MLKNISVGLFSMPRSLDRPGIVLIFMGREFVTYHKWG